MLIRKASRELFFEQARTKDPVLFDRLMSGGDTTQPLECWLWRRSKDGCGYGLMRVKGPKKKVHRISYELFYGQIPPSYEVRHLCDTPSCFNPLHLRIGTHKENMQDRVIRKRGGNLKGMNNGRSVLTDDQVREIKYSSKKTSELVREYGVSKVTICGIRRGAKWRHIQ